MKFFMDRLINTCYSSSIKNMKLINEFRKYCAKNKIFKILCEICGKRKRLREFIEEKRMKILTKFFEILKISTFSQIQIKQTNKIWMMNIFHQWKTLTKLSVLRKLEL